MANIFGTIISVGEFLKNEDTQVSIQRGYETNNVFMLAKGRKYIIPDYQREIRWSRENLIELMADINHGVKFLGNIILNRRSSSEYEVIDGQQRTTVLMMIIHYIESKYGQAINNIETCKLEMVNFDKFETLMQNRFSMAGCSPDICIQIENSDVFNQRERYHEIWNEFEHIDLLQSTKLCDTFLTNLRRSEINLIVNTNDTDNYSIDYFLDVNLKGVKLDTEDIFKGYLFRQDSKPAIRDEWKTFKLNTFKLNKGKKTEYLTTKLLEHYFYCNLYKEQVYENIQFKEDFTIYEVVLSGNKHYAGEHLIKAIGDNAYMLQSLKNINKFLTIVLDILSSELPTQNFKDLFNPSAHVDNVEQIIIHNFIRKIMLDKNIIPRILIMKYVIEVLFDRTSSTKDDYRKIYGIYLLAVLFTVFEGDKDVKKVIGVVKDNDWYNKAIEQSKSYFSRSKISKSRITAQYKLVNSGDEENHMFRCKSLATIYNFFEIYKNTVTIRNGKMNDLKIYISDSEKFSNEHFIINSSKVFILLEGNNIRKYQYPTEIKKYTNSIFNFIFVTRNLNDELGSNALYQKICILDEKMAASPNIIECEFSKMIIERCRRDFTTPVKLPIENFEEAANTIKSFYQNDFIDQFSVYALEVIKEIGNKLGVT